MDWRDIERMVRDAQDPHTECEQPESALDESVANAIKKLDLHNQHMILFLR